MSGPENRMNGKQNFVNGCCVKFLRFQCLLRFLLAGVGEKSTQVSQHPAQLVMLFLGPVILRLS